MHKTMKCNFFTCVRAEKSDGSEAAKGVGVEGRPRARVGPSKEVRCPEINRP